MIRNDRGAIALAKKIIHAQEKLLMAYRIGSQPSESVFKTLDRKQEFLDYESRKQ